MAKDDQRKNRKQKRKAFNEKQLWVPTRKKLVQPLSAQQHYRNALKSHLPPSPSDPGYEEFFRVAKIAFDADPNAASIVRKAAGRVFQCMNLQASNGTGLNISELLRYFANEYNNRLMNNGADSFPTSFNVMSSFVKYEKKFLSFTLLDERDALLNLDVYLDWYTNDSFPDIPSALLDVIDEDVIYSYEFAYQSDGYRVSAGGREVLFAGISMVRHEDDLSICLLGGECPPRHSDDEIKQSFAMREDQGAFNFKGLDLTENYDIQSRYLDISPTSAKILHMTHVNLRHSKIDLEYLLFDTGPSYTVETNDQDCMSPLPESEIQALASQARECFDEYKDFMSMARCLIYLPVFFNIFSEKTVGVNFATPLVDNPEISADSLDKDIIEKLHREEIAVVLMCDSEEQENLAATISLATPDFEFESSGYWKAIQPGGLGVDKQGRQTVGRTWVESKHSWENKTTGDLLLKKNTVPAAGNHPGILYLMRSDSHMPNLYKIGLTRRDTTVRSKELSTTGVPTNLLVLAEWAVGNCQLIEQIVHQRLGSMRLNKRREFFQGELQQIVRVICAVIDEYEGEKKTGHSPF